MRRHNIMFAVVLLLIPLFTSAQVYKEPEQVHLSYGDAPTEMVITWVTMNSTVSSVVEFGLSGLTKAIQGFYTTFQDGGKLKRILYIHRVVLYDLIPGQHYMYHCGSSEGWSDLFFFNAMKEGNQWPFRAAVYGDLGNKNPQSLPRLQEEVQKGHFDAILHNGDFAYNMDTNNALYGDEFMRQIQAIAAYIPYMTCPGNHENAYNFSNYKNRFTMPSDNMADMFYSFNVGPAHIISVNTEEYYYYVSKTTIVQQYEWLQKDLIKANLPENRAQQPWIIAMGHKPLYCSNSNDPTICTNFINPVRVGRPAFYLNMEDLYYKYGVDLYFGAHEHSYERLWPVYNLRVCNGSYQEPYTNPRAPVHIVTGSGGCQEKHDPFLPVGLPWSAFRSDDYGYTRMTVHNSSHLSLQQVSDDKGGLVVDRMMLIKDRHGAGLYDCDH